MPMTSSRCTVSVIITAFDRMEELRQTLRRIFACQPAPAEVLVHVDGGRADVTALVQAEFPAVRLFSSQCRLGPGGARNRLIRAAAQEWVASFDDDSRPVDDDYFARVERMMTDFPQADLLATRIYIQGESPVSATPAEWGYDFVGCGCVYRRSSFLLSSGYVSLPLAYGMEEVDLALRMCAAGQKILQCNELQVFHDTDYRRHGDARVTKAGIVNSALHAYLRYPVVLWPLWLLQCVSRLFWLLRRGRLAGIATGLLGIPAHLWHYRAHRLPVRFRDVIRYQYRRRHPEPVSN